MAILVANGFMWKYKSKNHIEENPELREGRDRLFKGWLIFSIIPCLLMGFGMLTGLTENLHDYYLSEKQNPFVIFYYVVILIIEILGTRWIFFKGGAEKLVLHRFIATPVVGKEKAEVLKMKGMWILVLLSGAVGFYMMMNNNFQF